MKALPVILACAFLHWFTCFAADSVTELLLNDGSKIKGRVMSVSASEVTVMADFGVFRIELAKLTPETRAALTEANKPDSGALLRRISELEARISQLQQENEQLRRQLLTSTPAPGYRPSTGIQSLTPSGSGSTAPSGRQVTISSTGKRHNSGCRFYAGGRPCGPTDGIACKICGG